MQKRLLFGLVAILGFFQFSSAQSIISVEQQEQIPTNLLQFAFPFLNIDYGVTTYKVVYTGQDALGQPDTLSGLMGVPQTNEALLFPMAVYNHATIFFQEDAPSIIGAQERPIVNAFTTQGYITLAPDYIGYGVDSNELHNYLHRESQAQAGKDMILAVREWLEEEVIGHNNQLFTTGYSQGGHASASLQKLLEDENDPELQITAASHMSGPYIISLGDRALINATGIPPIPAYLVYRYVGYNAAYEWFDNLDALFTEPYVPTIDSFAQNQLQLDSFNVRLLELMTANGADLADLFQDSILTTLAIGDPNNPFFQDVADNDVFNYIPQAPTRLVYCTEDLTVPFTVAVFTDSVMNALGAEDVATLDAGPNNHLDCVIPAAIATLTFFDQYANVLINSTTDLSQAEPNWQLGPNPIRAGEQLQLQQLEDGPTDYQLLDFFGRIVQSGPINSQGSIQLWGQLAPGTYLLQLRANNRLAVRKVLIQ